MAFKAKTAIPRRGLDEAKDIATWLQSEALARSAQFQSVTESRVIIDSMQNIRARRAQLLTLAAIPGIAQYAKDQENDQAYDVIAEFNNMVAACDAVITQVVSTFPTDAGGRLLERELAADGGSVWETFTAAQLAGLRTVLDALAASIEA